MFFSDEHFMKKAYLEAEKALFADEIPIGAVVVLDDQIIGKGYNMTQRLQDVTAHAEIQAITAASQYLGAKYLTDCTLYVTLEPCAMCAGAIAWAQIKRLVFSCEDPKKGYTLFTPSILHPKIVVDKGVLATECSLLVKNFFLNKRR